MSPRLTFGVAIIFGIAPEVLAAYERAGRVRPFWGSLMPGHDWRAQVSADEALDFLELISGSPPHIAQPDRAVAAFLYFIEPKHHIYGFFQSGIPRLIQRKTNLWPEKSLSRVNRPFVNE